MKKATLRLAALAIIIGGTINETTAQVTGVVNNIKVITTAVPMLRISPDARATGMGETGIATSADAYSNFWNLGKTPFAKQNASFGLTYTPWLHDLNLKDVYLTSLAGFYKMGDAQAISLGLRYFSLGNIDFTTIAGTPDGSSRPREFSLDLGYSRKLSSKTGIGLGLKYVSSSLAVGNYGGINYKKGSSVSGDLHLYHTGAKENGEGLNWGLTLSNLGSKISYTDNSAKKDFIPANLGLGGAYTKVFDADSKLTFALDLNKLLVPLDTSAGGTAGYQTKSVVSSWTKSFGDKSGETKEITAGIGAEYTYKDQFSLRAGYFYENKLKGDRRYATVGAGLKYSMVGLNIAYIVPSGSGVTRTPLSNTFRLSLMFDIDKK
ncbi:MAG: type IX secretion system outer membrane channel protein PorV [Ferruginibacter sp.]|nr:type IX secretion system outer membrane channel protein PorV [Ferruginibacter sp.]